MPTELQELVEFIHHGNTQIRQLAVENLVPYSLSQPTIFKTNQLLPVRDLKLLVKDYAQIAKNTVTILINLSSDREVLKYLAGDNQFLELLLARVTNPSEPNANLIAMLLANMAKWDDLKRIITLQRPPVEGLSLSHLAIDHLVDLFVKGADGNYNKSADFDYLSYLFADIAKHPEGRLYFTTSQPYGFIIPLAKLIVFTNHRSSIRRKGVASAIKNVAFDISSHPAYLSSKDLNVLPYLLLPLMGNEEYDEEDMMAMLPDLQLLPPEKSRDGDADILQTHVETLMLLTTTREGRDYLREIRVYPIIRETHLHVEHEGVKEACERLVQVLMRGEEGNERFDQEMIALDKNEHVEKKEKTLLTSGELGSCARIGKIQCRSGRIGKNEDSDSDDNRVVEL